MSWMIGFKGCRAKFRSSVILCRHQVHTASRPHTVPCQWFLGASSPGHL